jgi:hypothetical protein
MGRSFVEFKEHGYWTGDHHLEGLLFMLIRELKKLNTKAEWQEAVVNKWTNAATCCSHCRVCVNKKYYLSNSRLVLWDRPGKSRLIFLSVIY